jgi:hypothetical protein
MSRMSENVGASSSRNPKGLHGLYRVNFTYLLLFDPKDGGDKFIRNVCRLSTDYTALQERE